MKARKFILAAICAMLLVPAMAQNDRGKTDDFGRIQLTTYLPAEAEMPPAARKILVNKMTNIATKNGLANSSFNSRFIFTATVHELASELTTTTPQMFVKQVEFNFYVGDGIDGTMFSSTSISSKGVGETEEKAYLSALKSISVNNPAFKPMLDKGKNRIIEYYNTNCDFILRDARTAATLDDYDASMLTLLSVPDICKECYDKCMAEAEKMYLEQLDREALQQLSAAKSIWAARQDSTAAVEACNILAIIDPKAPCYAQAEELRDKIQRWVRDKSDTERFDQILAQLDALDKKIEAQKEESWQEGAERAAAAAAKDAKEPEYKTDWAQ
ncbi:MAG: hypothetical protein IJ834_05645 [Paludibacteraceae bacterium]|nr:hypothetical protein [Paludibacteraceae bacterium]